MTIKNLYQKLDECLNGFESKLFSDEVLEYRKKLFFNFNSYLSSVLRERLGTVGVESFSRDISDFEKVEVFILFFECFGKSILKNKRKIKLRVFWDEVVFLERILEVLKSELFLVDLDKLCNRYSFIQFHPSLRILNLLDSGIEEIVDLLSIKGFKESERNFVRGMEEARKTIAQRFIEGLAINKKLFVVPVDVVSKVGGIEIGYLKACAGLFFEKIKYDSYIDLNVQFSLFKIFPRSLFVEDKLLPLGRMILVFNFKSNDLKNFKMNLNHCCVSSESNEVLFEPRFFTSIKPASDIWPYAFSIDSSGFDFVNRWSKMLLLDRGICSAKDKKFFSIF